MSNLKGLGTMPHYTPDSFRLRSSVLCKQYYIFDNTSDYFIPFSREQHNMLIVMEYPSRSNLNCVFWVLSGP